MADKKPIAIYQIRVSVATRDKSGKTIDHILHTINNALNEHPDSFEYAIGHVRLQDVTSLNIDEAEAERQLRGETDVEVKD